jgi:hypothetical protein
MSGERRQLNDLGKKPGFNFSSNAQKNAARGICLAFLPKKRKTNILLVAFFL